MVSRKVLPFYSIRNCMRNYIDTSTHKKKTNSNTVAIDTFSFKMQFSKAILIIPSLAMAVAANALPEGFSTQACGNPMEAICPNAVAQDNHDCTLSCMTGTCVEYDCQDGTHVSEASA